MKLQYVSMTGADDNTDVSGLNNIARDYPFVEWAILLMPERMGQNRIPSAAWIQKFKDTYRGDHTAMHLCGNGLHSFVENDKDVLDYMRGFKRIQLNLEFEDAGDTLDRDKLLERIRIHDEFTFIIQYTDKRSNWLPALAEIPNHALLFDGSAGRGELPDGWPEPIDGHFCGYAGGLSPDNIADNLEKISKAAGNTATWIDMETGVRTNDEFDLEKVTSVLNTAKPYVVV